LIDLGIVSRYDRHKLLVMPDYLLFRTHIHKLYREYLGFPRYSVIARKFTDEFQSNSEKSGCSLETIFICDGSTAQNNSQFFIPPAKDLELSVVGTSLDFTELPKLRFQPQPNIDFQPFKPYSLDVDGVMKPKLGNGHDVDSNTKILPEFWQCSLREGTDHQQEETIAIGAVKDLSEFFPTNFNFLRINIGDFVEYKQTFTLNEDKNVDKPLKTLILQEVEKIVTAFNIEVVFISFYKIGKYFGLNKNHSVLETINELQHSWNYSESMLVNNITRSVWEEEILHSISHFYDGHGYLILFNPC
ncbi:MAG: hypothetical protein KAT16_05490, partial [Candidatus Heimdallarchaeota archaeon]|nr:hypothetical protein [Candidatus Heimdallarchaeota archaeon]